MQRHGGVPSQKRARFQKCSTAKPKTGVDTQRHPASHTPELGGVTAVRCSRRKIEHKKRENEGGRKGRTEERKTGKHPTLPGPGTLSPDSHPLGRSANCTRCPTSGAVELHQCLCRRVMQRTLPDTCSCRVCCPPTAHTPVPCHRERCATDRALSGTRHP